jgi:hypothetical protein
MGAQKISKACSGLPTHRNNYLKMLEFAYKIIFTVGEGGIETGTALLQLGSPSRLTQPRHHIPAEPPHPQTEPLHPLYYIIVDRNDRNWCVSQWCCCRRWGAT